MIWAAIILTAIVAHAIYLHSAKRKWQELMDAFQEYGPNIPFDEPEE